MDYNNSYKKHHQLWGNMPNNLITMFEGEFEQNCNCLDLGSGQGRDSLYLAGKNFKVTSVDSSGVGVDQLKGKSIEQGLVSNLELICEDVLSFNIPTQKFKVINAINLLQFLPRQQSLLLIDNIRKSIANSGFIIIKAFTVNDSSFIKKRDNKNMTFFYPDELKGIFNDFKIRHYFEYITLDQGHGDTPEPHLHGIVEIVAQKI